jgi:cyclophilin family peptidyl-prolyl cis-trans isomerase
MLPKSTAFIACLTLVVAVCGGDASSAPGAGSAQAPDSFAVRLTTSGGEMVVRFHRSWSPLAVDRVYGLVTEGFYDGARFYRVNDQYVQFGFSGRPELDRAWFEQRLPDEPVRASNVRGTVAFGRAGPSSRNFVLFVNLGDNSFLDSWAGDGVPGFPPVGRMESGIDVAEGLNGAYGDAIVPMEDSILASGNAFLDRSFPGLDSILTAEVVRQW